MRRSRFSDAPDEVHTFGNIYHGNDGSRHPATTSRGSKFPWNIVGGRAYHAEANDAGEHVDISDPNIFVLDASDMSNPLNMAYRCHMMYADRVYDSMLHAYYIAMVVNCGKPRMHAWLMQQLAMCDKPPDISMCPNTDLFPAEWMQDSHNRCNEEELLAVLLDLKWQQCPEFAEALKAPPPYEIMVKANDEHLGCGFEDTTLYSGENLYGKVLLRFWAHVNLLDAGQTTKVCGPAPARLLQKDRAVQSTSLESSSIPNLLLGILSSNKPRISANPSSIGRDQHLDDDREENQGQARGGSSDSGRASNDSDHTSAKSDSRVRNTHSIDRNKNDASPQPYERHRKSPERRHTGDYQRYSRDRRSARRSNHSPPPRPSHRSSERKDRSRSSGNRRRTSRDRSDERRSNRDYRRSGEAYSHKSRERSRDLVYGRNTFLREQTPAPMKTGFYGHYGRITRGRGRGSGLRSRGRGGFFYEYRKSFTRRVTPSPPRRRSPTVPYRNGQTIRASEKIVQHGQTSTPKDSIYQGLRRRKESGAGSPPREPTTEGIVEVDEAVIAFSPDPNVEKEINQDETSEAHDGGASPLSITTSETSATDNLSVGCRSITLDPGSNPLSPAEPSTSCVDLLDTLVSLTTEENSDRPLCSSIKEESASPGFSISTEPSHTDCSSTLDNIKSEPDQNTNTASDVKRNDEIRNNDDFPIQRPPSPHCGQAAPLAFPNDLSGILAECFAIAVERRNRRVAADADDFDDT